MFKVVGPLAAALTAAVSRAGGRALAGIVGRGAFFSSVAGFAALNTSAEELENGFMFRRVDHLLLPGLGDRVDFESEGVRFFRGSREEYRSYAPGCDEVGEETMLSNA